MENKIKRVISELRDEILTIKDLEALKQIKAKYVSKSELLKELKEEIKVSENKAEIGKLINFYNTEAIQIINDKKDELENAFAMVERENPILNENSIEPEINEGTIHPLSMMKEIVMNFFDKLGFEYSHGKEIEDEEINFNRLNIPEDHPARTMQDTFYLSEKGKVLRTHSTNMTARELESLDKEEYKSYSIGTVFRNDENDATHSFQFNQIDAFRVGKEISVANLKWIIDGLLKEVFSQEIDVRYRPSYFPFTEPSFEVDIKRPEDEKWIEVLGCGLIHPNVIKKAGKNPEELQGYAIGVGLERLTMIKYGIKDIRKFVENDIDFLKEVK